MYKSQFPRKGILQIAEQLPQFIENYNGRIHSTTRRSPDEAWAEYVICKNRDSLNETGRERASFQVGDLVRVRKERTVFTKQRAEVYRERYTITKKEANMYTLSGEYEGRDILTHHITVKGG